MNEQGFLELILTKVRLTLPTKVGLVLGMLVGMILPKNLGLVPPHKTGVGAGDAGGDDLQVVGLVCWG